jgi:spore coat polysaccharide biosynthesis predicted glycosyltransferase SpsG
LFFDLLRGIEEWNSPQQKHILIWIHPKEDPYRWTKLLADLKTPYSVKISLDRGASVLRHIDLLVSAYSTVLYEAMYYDVPCLSLQTGLKVADELITNALKLTIPIYSMAELRKTLQSLNLTRLRISQGKRRDYLAEQGIFFSDGRATKRVLSVIEKIL